MIEAIIAWLGMSVLVFACYLVSDQSHKDAAEKKKLNRDWNNSQTGTRTIS